MDDRLFERFDVKIRPSSNRRTHNVYLLPLVQWIPEGSAPNLKNNSFSITADVDIAESGTEGVLVTQGGRFAGWSFFLEDGKPTLCLQLC